MKSRSKKLIFILAAVITSVAMFGCEETAKKTSLDLLSDIQQNVIGAMSVGVILPDGSERPLNAEPVPKNHQLLLTFQEDMTELVGWVNDNFSVQSERGEVRGSMDWWDPKTAIYTMEKSRYGAKHIIMLGGLEAKSYRIAALGDVNGDGFADLVAGAPEQAHGNRMGKAYLFFGGMNIQSATVDSADVTFRGEDESGNDKFGGPCGVIGDINADGYMDVVLGAPIRDNSKGRLYVMLGSAVWEQNYKASDAYLIIDGMNPGDMFGSNVSAAGDVDGDGYDDLLVGIPDGYNKYGGVYLFSGRDLTDAPNTGSLKAKATFIGEEAGWRFGDSVTAADIDGDGFNDIIVGSPNARVGIHKDVGRVYMFKGGESVTSVNLKEQPTGAHVTVYGQVNDFVWGEEPGPSLFGRSVSSAGDVDLDGKDDIVVGAQDVKVGNEINAGAAYLLTGSRLVGELSPFTIGSEARVAVGAHSDEWVGASVSGVGSFNGDEYDDIVVGGPGKSFPGGGFEGSIQFVVGGSSLAVKKLDNNEAQSFFGGSLMHLGDFNGDGLSDFAVGSPHYGNLRGRVTIFRGNRDGFLSMGEAISIMGTEEGSMFGGKMANQLVR